MKDVNILIFGDSIAYGSCDKENLGWVNQLRLNLANREDRVYNVFNLGVPGDTTIDLKKRFKHECNARYDIDAKTYIVVAMGINDSQIFKGANRVDESIFVNNIVKLIAQSMEYTNSILFVGLTRVDESKVSPVPWNNNIIYSNDEISKFDKCLENLCTNCDVNYLNISDLLNNDDLEDGLHPTSAGHQKLYEEIYKHLEVLKWI